MNLFLTYKIGIGTLQGLESHIGPSLMKFNSYSYHILMVIWIIGLCRVNESSAPKTDGLVDTVLEKSESFHQLDGENPFIFVFKLDR